MTSPFVPMSSVFAQPGEVETTATKSEMGMPALFSDGMVLQRGIELPFWGVTTAGQKVTVKMGEQSVSTVAGADGAWSLKLAPLQVGIPRDVTITGKNTLVLRDVLVGDVWIASGQSNMAFALRNGKNGANEVAAANDDSLRMFTVPREPNYDTPQRKLGGKWLAATPQNAAGFSAVAYFFARELRRELGVPIGIIHSSWGGTVAQAWTSRDVLQSNPTLKTIVDKWQKSQENYPEVKAKYDADLAAWQIEADKAKADGSKIPRKPAEPRGPTFVNRPSGLYNGMIAPLVPYGIKGAIWYQGESNASDAEQYKTLFPAMISGWRRDWKQGDFPFLFVQLANYKDVQKEPSEGGWAEIREAQSSALSLKNTGLATAIDLADTDNPRDIHPKNKQDVGRRLALVALAQVYGKAVIYSGPVYQSMKTQGSTIRLSFAHTEGGLKTRDGADLQGFAIAGADQKWVWADAEIDGNDVVVSNPKVPQPTAVRYAWASNPIGNLANGAGLPATPFRTDK